MKHQVKKTKYGNVYLRNEKTLNCPWNRSTYCGDWCPFFEFSNVLNGYRLTLSCVPCAKLIALDEENPIVEA